MRKFLIVIMALAAAVVLCACGSDQTADAPAVYSPTDIQVETTDGVNVYSVIYDIDNTSTDEWSGYDTNDNEVQTAIDGIKDCKDRGDWVDGSVVYGYSKEPALKNMLYQYGSNGIDGDYNTIRLYQCGVFNDEYTLQGELDQTK